MQTSATGRWTASPRSRGFTLLEVMLVVAIVGIVAAAAIIALPDRAEDDLELAANRLLTAIEDCRHSAVLTGIPAGLSLSAAGYRDRQYRGAWHASERARETSFGPGIESSHDDGDSEAPGVVCLPTGETRLPPLSLVHRATGTSIELSSDEYGDIVAAFAEPPT